jgi:predicted nucleic acid-binding protein
LNLIDPSGWIEYLSGGENAGFFADPLESEETFVVPSLSLYEVFEHLLRHVEREEALRVAASMRRRQIVDLDSSLALQAAELTLEHRLAMADRVILATARALDAYLWTQHSDFEGLEKVHFTPNR